MIRPAADADLPVLRALTEAYLAEFWRRRWAAPRVDEEWLRRGTAFVVEEEGDVVGMAKGDIAEGVGRVSLVYLRPGYRRSGIGTALLGELARWFRGHGVEHVTLGVDTSNADAAAVWSRLGFRDYRRELATTVEALERRLAEQPRGRTYGSIHVQSDDLPVVERAVRQFLPRLAGGSRGSVVSQPSNGWIGVYDELCDREPAALRRLAVELSDRLGAVVLVLGVEHGDVVRFVLLERGRIMDEYLSVPDYHGPLPPGDIVALRANPTVVARLTGADPAAVRAAARSATSPEELPPAEELLARVAAAIGVEGAARGYEEARRLPHAVVLERD